MDEFDRYRADMNEKLLGSNHLGIKRFFALDTQAYEDGALDKRTKELLGLVASIVLRCDDCITYHIKQSIAAGVTRPAPARLRRYGATQAVQSSAFRLLYHDNAS